MKRLVAKVKKGASGICQRPETYEGKTLVHMPSGLKKVVIGHRSKFHGDGVTRHTLLTETPEGYPAGDIYLPNVGRSWWHESDVFFEDSP